MSTSFIIRLLETRAARDLIIEIKLIKNLSLPKSNSPDINFDAGEKRQRPLKNDSGTNPRAL
jgi:hypothetical protein